ncbi:mycothiol-dependent nitroreductase Rv2466c family protein [Streptomyces sp. 1222.5]|uniref:mycothiol-dependent nitroreductase Rv2466c family protein n=1 Tax=Streptomyces sp. 1222.5 TaxID=1881026 RepID=UPI003D714127
MTAPPSSVDFHFDPMCPFAYAASLWIRDVRAQIGTTVNWRFFSLEEVNRADGRKHPWERPWSYGWSLMRIGALLRRQDPALLDAWYLCIGQELHERGGKPHDPDVARTLLRSIGQEPAVLDEALADSTTHDDIRTDHQRVLDAGGFGVPTLFFPDGQCLFGPVLIHPPTGDRAVRLWDSFTALLEFPHVYEIQRPKNAAAQTEILTAMQPYLAGRDWVTVDRGKVLEIPVPAEAATEHGETPRG